MDRVKGFIKAITSFGSDDYELFECFYTEENKALYETWLRDQPKVDGITLYRGYVFDEEYFGLNYLNVGDIVGMDNLTQLDMPSFSDHILPYCFDFGETSISGNIKVIFEIITHGKYFVDISENSFYKIEKEYKCTSNVHLKIINISEKYGYYNIKLEET